MHLYTCISLHLYFTKQNKTDTFHHFSYLYTNPFNYPSTSTSPFPLSPSSSPPPGTQIPTPFLSPLIPSVPCTLSVLLKYRSVTFRLGVIQSPSTLDSKLYLTVWRLIGRRCSVRNLGPLNPKVSLASIASSNVKKCMVGFSRT